VIYTGIGSRSTPEAVLSLIECIGSELAGVGYTLRSGGAVGADRAFERGCDYHFGTKEIYVPWGGFASGVNVSDFDNFDEAMKIAEKFHPAWDRCAEPVKKLHTRNVYQILGSDLNTPTDFVVCWTKDGSGAGGTGQALRIAKYLNIPIFDLGLNETLDKLTYHVNNVI